MTCHTLPIWTYWEGKMPPVIELCLETIERHHPSLRVLGRQDVIYMGGQDIFDRTKDNLVSHRSDLIRFWLMSKFGGVWFDADTIMLGPTALTQGDADYYCAKTADGSGRIIGAHFAFRSIELGRQAYGKCLQKLTMPNRAFAATSSGALTDLVRQIENGSVAWRINFCDTDIIDGIALPQNKNKLLIDQPDQVSIVLNSMHEDCCRVHLNHQTIKKLEHMTRDELLDSPMVIGHLFRRALA